jgi:hypothetical protein
MSTMTELDKLPSFGPSFSPSVSETYGLAKLRLSRRNLERGDFVGSSARVARGRAKFMSNILQCATKFSNEVLLSFSSQSCPFQGARNPVSRLYILHRDLQNKMALICGKPCSQLYSLLVIQAYLLMGRLSYVGHQAYEFADVACNLPHTPEADSLHHSTVFNKFFGDEITH